MDESSSQIKRLGLRNQRHTWKLSQDLLRKWQRKQKFCRVIIYETNRIVNLLIHYMGIFYQRKAIIRF